MCFHKRVLMFTSMHKFSVTRRACWTFRQTVCQPALSCWRIFTQAHLRPLKCPSCSLLFWNRSQRCPRITVMMCVREKSKEGTPASRLRLLHPSVFLCSPVKDVLSNINHTPKHWWILKSFRDQGYCPQVCALPQSASLFILSLLLPWDFTKLKACWHLLQDLRSLSITEQTFCTNPVSQFFGHSIGISV